MGVMKSPHDSIKENAKKQVRIYVVSIKTQGKLDEKDAGHLTSSAHKFTRDSD